jgi:hypothetical protein
MQSPEAVLTSQAALPNLKTNKRKYFYLQLIAPSWVTCAECTFLSSLGTISCSETLAYLKYTNVQIKAFKYSSCHLWSKHTAFITDTNNEIFNLPTTERMVSLGEPQWGQEFSLHIIQTGYSGAVPIYYTIASNCKMMSEWLRNMENLSLNSSWDLNKDWTQVKPQPTCLVTPMYWLSKELQKLKIHFRP